MREKVAKKRGEKDLDHPHFECKKVKFNANEFVVKIKV